MNGIFLSSDGIIRLNKCMNRLFNGTTQLIDGITGSSFKVDMDRNPKSNLLLLSSTSKLHKLALIIK